MTVKELLLLFKELLPIKSFCELYINITNGKNFTFKNTNSQDVTVSDLININHECLNSKVTKAYVIQLLCGPKLYIVCDYAIS